MPAKRSQIDEVALRQDDRFRRQRHEAYEMAYGVWLETLPEEERLRLKELKLDEPEGEQFGPVRKPGRDEPVFERDISGDLSVDATEEDCRELEAAIMRALHWALAGKTVVEVGMRFLLVMQVWKSPLIAGLQLQFERELLDECAQNVGDDDGSSGHLMEWIRRGGTVSQVGQRVMAMAYVLNPSAIGSASLQAIGACTNKTRQAVCKIVQDFRDSFGGIRSRAMRPDSTRLLCKIAQLEGHYGDERFAGT